MEAGDEQRQGRPGDGGSGGRGAGPRGSPRASALPLARRHQPELLRQPEAQRVSRGGEHSGQQQLRGDRVRRLPAPVRSPRRGDLRQADRRLWRRGVLAGHPRVRALLHLPRRRRELGRPGAGQLHGLRHSRGHGGPEAVGVRRQRALHASQEVLPDAQRPARPRHPLVERRSSRRHPRLRAGVGRPARYPHPGRSPPALPLERRLHRGPDRAVQGARPGGRSRRDRVRGGREVPERGRAGHPLQRQGDRASSLRPGRAAQARLHAGADGGLQEAVLPRGAGRDRRESRGHRGQAATDGRQHAVRGARLRGLQSRHERAVRGARRVKKPLGYSGGLCTQGSREYVTFWADLNANGFFETCLGTASVQVHDIAEVPSQGLEYAVFLPVDFGPYRRPCQAGPRASCPSAQSCRGTWFLPARTRTTCRCGETGKTRSSRFPPARRCSPASSARSSTRSAAPACAPSTRVRVSPSATVRSEGSSASPARFPPRSPSPCRTPSSIG